MASIPPDLEARAKAYCSAKGLTIDLRLGNGIQGVVYSTNRKTAIKIFAYQEHFETERDVYQRLQSRGFSVVDGFNVPKLLGFNNKLRIVEMEVVNPPYILDFASAYLDRKPPYDLEQMEEWEEERAELFGEDWPRVRSVLSRFRAIGVHLVDVKPGNITVRD